MAITISYIDVHGNGNGNLCAMLKRRVNAIQTLS